MCQLTKKRNKFSMTLGNNCKEKHVQKWNKPKLTFFLSWFTTAWKEFSGSWHCSVTEPENKFCSGNFSAVFRHHSATGFPSWTELVSSLEVARQLSITQGASLQWTVAAVCPRVQRAVEGAFGTEAVSVQQHIMQLALFYLRKTAK